MKLFKKSTLGLALTAALTGGAMMGVSAPAEAAFGIAPDGLGQVLVFPYYTTRNGWNTYFNITNTSDKTVAVKVRWREAHNSRDVRDFNVILSPYDVWTAATVDGTDGARMVTSDTTCTVPQLPSAGGSLTGIGFTNTAYIKKGVQDNRDKGPASLDRTREGYFEVIEMGVIDGNDTLNIARNAKHSNVGDNTATPRNCAAIDSLFASNLTGVQGVFAPPENVLKGRAVLINAATGVAAGYDPLVIEDFSPIPLVNAPSSPSPSLEDAAGGVAAVDTLLMRNGVINDYNVATNSQTDWVMTFPTKNFAVDEGYAASANFAAVAMGGGAPLAPFNTLVNGERFSGVQEGKSCFDVSLAIWDREEYKDANTLSNAFSPAEPGEAGDRMCYEANILSFGESDVFGSKVRKTIGTLPGKYGWANIGFGGASLPVIGMRVEQRNKGDATINFAFASDHAYTK